MSFTYSIGSWGRRALLAATLVAAGGAAVAGCGGGGGGDPDARLVDAPPSNANTYFPLAVGNTWTYKVTDPMNPGAPAETKTLTVDAYGEVGGEKTGVFGYRIVTTRPGNENVSWQSLENDVVVRHRDVEYDVVGMNKAQTADVYYFPSKIRVDGSAAHTTASAQWESTHTEKTYNAANPTGLSVVKTEQWTVEAVGVSVTVPAGTFDCLQVRRVNTTGGTAGSDKTFWFALGVGKVKETGGQTEELQSYTVGQ